MLQKGKEFQFHDEHRYLGVLFPGDPSLLFNCRKAATWYLCSWALFFEDEYPLKMKAAWAALFSGACVAAFRPRYKCSLGTYQQLGGSLWTAPLHKTRKRYLSCFFIDKFRENEYLYSPCLLPSEPANWVPGWHLQYWLNLCPAREGLCLSDSSKSEVNVSSSCCCSSFWFGSLECCISISSSKSH